MTVEENNKEKSIKIWEWGRCTNKFKSQEDANKRLEERLEGRGEDIECYTKDDAFRLSRTSFPNDLFAWKNQALFTVGLCVASGLGLLYTARKAWAGEHRVRESQSEMEQVVTGMPGRVTREKGVVEREDLDLVLRDAPNGEEHTCAICLEGTNNSEASALPCDHVFHGACIRAWFSKGGGSCPCCAFDVVKESKKRRREREGVAEGDGEGAREGHKCSG